MISFACQAGWKIPFDFLKYVVRGYGMSGSTQIKVVSIILRTLHHIARRNLSP